MSRAQTLRLEAAIVCALVLSGACASAGRSVRLDARTPPSDTGRTPAGASAATALEAQDRLLVETLRRVRLERTPEYLAGVGFRYYELGVRDAAMDYFAASLALAPRFAPALDGAARVWRDWGDLDAAAGHAHRATHFAPASAEAWNTKGTVMQALGLHAEAAAAYRRTIDLDASASYARSNLCYLAFLRAEPGEAVSECSSAIAIDSAFAPARNNLALTYAALGESALAFETFAASAGKAVAHYNMGIVRLAQRQYPEAVGEFEAAYGIDPDFDDARAHARYARRLAQARGSRRGTAAR